MHILIEPVSKFEYDSCGFDSVSNMGPKDFKGFILLSRLPIEHWHDQQQNAFL